jgi:hypothetical protein
MIRIFTAEIFFWRGGGGIKQNIVADISLSSTQRVGPSIPLKNRKEKKKPKRRGPFQVPIKRTRELLSGYTLIPRAAGECGEATEARTCS